MTLRLTALAGATLLLLAPATAPAQQVYQWKDANGVTQYSGTPPDNVDYQTREIHVREGTAPEAAGEPAENPACTTARGNLALLDSDQKVSVDTDGDGEPDHNLDDAERAAQRDLAEATIKVECAAATAPEPEAQ